MEKRKAVFPSLPHLTQIYRRMWRKMRGKIGSGDVTWWGHAATSLRCLDAIGESSLASQICELDVRLAVHCLLDSSSTGPHQWGAAITLLIHHGWQAREGRMTAVEGVLFFHRSSTPTAHETFLTLYSHVYVPSLMSLLFCFLLLSDFRLSEPSAQEGFLSLLATTCPVCCCLSASSSHQLSSLFAQSFSPSHCSAADGGGCTTSLVEISMPIRGNFQWSPCPALDELKVMTRATSPLPACTKHPLTLNHAHKKCQTSQTMTSTKSQEHVCEIQHELACDSTR